MAATKGRFSILKMMAVVSIVAAELGFLRLVVDTTLMEAVMFLPMLTAMAFGLTRLRLGEQARRYWTGFEAVGMTLIGLFYLLSWSAPSLMFLIGQPLQWLADRGWIGGGGESPEALAVGCAWIFAIYVPPQFLAASFVGWFASRYRIAIERRPRPARATLAGS